MVTLFKFTLLCAASMLTINNLLGNYHFIYVNIYDDSSSIAVFSKQSKQQQQQKKNVKMYTCEIQMAEK